MAPIRVALIGLSSSAKVTWAADAHLPYLLSPIGQKHYELTVRNFAVKHPHGRDLVTEGTDVYRHFSTPA